MTEGQKLAEQLRSNFRIGTRTRRYRNGVDLHSEIVEAIQNATIYPGYYSGERQLIFSSAWAVYLSYAKHVTGGRIDPMLALRISRMSPYRFASMLGEMVDAHVSNVGDGERFFREMARR